MKSQDKKIVEPTKSLEEIERDVMQVWLPLRFWHRLFEAAKYLIDTRRLLLYGPVGCGKTTWVELVYLAIFYPDVLVGFIPKRFRNELQTHIRSPMRLRENINNPPFIKKSGANVIETLTENTLFGYAPGAFTGANAQGQTGLAELADGGLLFIDESQELLLPTQGKLLQFLDDSGFYKQGGNTFIRVNLLTVLSVNDEPAILCNDRILRKDIQSRFSASIVKVPAPMDYKPEELISIAKHVLSLQNQLLPKQIRGFSGEVEESITLFPWQLGIRQFVLALQSAANKCKTEVIHINDLPLPLLHADLTTLIRLKERSLKRAELREKKVMKWLKRIVGHKK